MNVLGIAGSPRRGGNTQLLLDRALEGVRDQGAETQKLILNDLEFSPCQECGDCDDTGVCTYEDDMAIVYDAVKQADALILSSPIFFGSLSAQTKMMIDRFQCWWAAKYLFKQPIVPKERKRNGLFISVSGRGNADHFENAKKIVKIFFLNIEVAYAGELFYPRIDKKSEILGHPSAMDEVFAAGKNLVPAGELQET
jgi:multimeric flavodoxin WrbA